MKRFRNYLVYELYRVNQSVLEDAEKQENN